MVIIHKQKIEDIKNGNFQFA